MDMIEPLIELQDLDGRIRELESEAKDLPQRKAKENARMAGVNASLDIAKKQLDANQRRIKECETEAAELREKVRNLRITQATSKSNKEFSQLNIQIESLEHDADAAEARQLALMDEIPTLEAGVKEADEKVKAEQGGVDGYVGELDSRLAEVKAQLDELAAERKAAATKVQPRFLAYYERLRTKRWPVVAPLTDDGVCDGCHLMQPPSVAQMVEHNVKAAEMGRDQALVACTMCGRILYRA